MEKIKFLVGTTKPVADNPEIKLSADRTALKEVVQLYTADSTDNGAMTFNEKISKQTTTTPTVHDVAAYILQRCGAMTAMKLQKLVYYCQAWSLVWDEMPLFEEDIQAWANGPVVPALYERHKGKFQVSTWHGNPDVFNAAQRETIDNVLRFYADKSSQILSDLTHMEEPWLQARKGLAIGERGNEVITLASMAEYYGSL